MYVYTHIDTHTHVSHLRKINAFGIAAEWLMFFGMTGMLVFHSNSVQCSYRYWFSLIDNCINSFILFLNAMPYDIYSIYMSKSSMKEGKKSLRNKFIKRLISFSYFLPHILRPRYPLANSRKVQYQFQSGIRRIRQRFLRCRFCLRQAETSREPTLLCKVAGRWAKTNVAWVQSFMCKCVCIGNWEVFVLRDVDVWSKTCYFEVMFKVFPNSKSNI